MLMTPLQGPKNQHVECALEQFDTVLIVRCGSHMVVDTLLLSHHAVDCLLPPLAEVSVIRPKADWMADCRGRPPRKLHWTLSEAKVNAGRAGRIWGSRINHDVRLFPMPAMDRDELLAFMRRERYACRHPVPLQVIPKLRSSASYVSDRFEVFFDTLDTSRKAANLRRNPSVAFVIGLALANSECTVQLEGVADEPTGSELESLLEIYFAKFPDGRSRRSWPGVDLCQSNAHLDPL